MHDTLKARHDQTETDGVCPRVSDLGGVHWGLRMCSSSQVMLLLLLLGVDHFENR